MNSKEPFSIIKRLRSFTHAYNGFLLFLKTEHNSWIHVSAALVAIALGAVFRINKGEWCLLGLSIGMVLSTEIINTAIEKLTDLVSPGHSISAKNIKDMSAAAVLLASLFALITGAIIFIPHILSVSFFRLQ